MTLPLKRPIEQWILNYRISSNAWYGNWSCDYYVQVLVYQMVAGDWVGCGVLLHSWWIQLHLLPRLPLPTHSIHTHMQHHTLVPPLSFYYRLISSIMLAPLVYRLTFPLLPSPSLRLTLNLFLLYSYPGHWPYRVLHLYFGSSDSTGRLCPHLGWNLVRTSAIHSSVHGQPHMYTYSAVMYSLYRIGYAEENDNRGWYIGKPTSPSICVWCFTTKYYIHQITLVLSNFCLVFSPKVCWYFQSFFMLARWLELFYSTSSSRRWGGTVGTIKLHDYCFNMLCLLSVQLASCTLNKLYISSTLILSVVVSILAILPWVQKGTTILLTSIASFPSFHPLVPVQGGGLGTRLCTLHCIKKQVY